MFVSFDSISPAARVWIYQSGKKFSTEEKTIIEESLKLFIEQWAAHGQPLKASFSIRYDQFIVIAADEAYNSTSGCSIDESVRIVKEIEQRVKVSLFDHLKVGFFEDGSVFLIPLNELRQKYEEGAWNENTLAFNNLVTIKGQLETHWIMAAGNTWIKRYVPAKKVSA